MVVISNGGGDREKWMDSIAVLKGEMSAPAFGHNRRWHSSRWERWESTFWNRRTPEFSFGCILCDTHMQTSRRRLTVPD